MSISVLIITYNEEANLPRCLESVRWSDDIHVVDSGSADRTQEIARRAGAHLSIHAFAGYAAQLNWAFDNLSFRHPWILYLDADEWVSPALAAELHAAVANADPGVAGFDLALRVYFLRRWIPRATLYERVWFLRLCRLDRVRYEDRQINPYPAVSGRVPRLSHPLEHDNRKGVTDLVAKYHRYAVLEAEETLRLRRGQASRELQPRWGGDWRQRRRRLKQLHLRLPLRGLRKFLYLYLWRRGFLDGAPGLLFCLLMAAQDFMLSRILGARKRNLPVG